MHIRMLSNIPRLFLLDDPKSPAVEKHQVTYPSVGDTNKKVEPLIDGGAKVSL